MKKFTVKNTEDGMRLLRLVTLLTTNMPKSLLYKSFRTGRIKVCGIKQKENYRVCTGQIIYLYINDEFFCEKKKLQNPADNFAVIYTDDNIAILQKPAGILCHSDCTGDANLLDGFIARFGSGTFRPCLVNRIDRGTEGLVIVARTHPAAEATAFALKNIEKHYLVVTAGAVNGEVSTGFHRENRHTTAILGEDDMKTHFTTIENKAGLYLLCAKLITGKTHQIRAQLAALGIPIIGDKRYGNTALNSKYTAKTQLLCAYRLIFPIFKEDNPLFAVSGKEFTCNGCYTMKFFDNFS